MRHARGHRRLQRGRVLALCSRAGSGSGKVAGICPGHVQHLGVSKASGH